METRMPVVDVKELGWQANLGCSRKDVVCNCEARTRTRFLKNVSHQVGTHMFSREWAEWPPLQKDEREIRRLPCSVFSLKIKLAVMSAALLLRV